MNFRRGEEMMTKRFPRTKVEITYDVKALHTVPESLHSESKEPHEHTWWITFIYHHERNGPFTWDRAEFHKRILPTVERMRGANLTEVMGESASDEVIATWTLKQVPGWIDAVRVDRLTALNEPSVKAVAIVTRKDL